jgi:hypothetical protein
MLSVTSVLITEIKKRNRMARKYSPGDLLTPDQCADALGHNVTAQAIRKHVRLGHLPFTRPPNPESALTRKEGWRVFVRRGDLMKLYAHKLDGWKGVKKGNR